jgi:AcrR family transcriptional regulator
MNAKKDQEANPGADTTIKRILFNALEHFSLYGYTGASVREITQASQVTKPTLYYYFKSKDELYTRLAETCFEEIINQLNVAVVQPGTAKERILHFIKEYSRICDERRSVARFIHLMSLVPDRNAPNVGVTNFYLKLGDYFRNILSEGASRGEVKEEMINCSIYALYSIFYLRISNMLANDPIPHDFAVVESAVDLVLSQR